MYCQHCVKQIDEVKSVMDSLGMVQYLSAIIGTNMNVGVAICARPDILYRYEPRRRSADGTRKERE